MALDFLPEQETVQKQYYTGIGEYNEQYKNSNLNKIYKKIINQKKIRAGFEDIWRCWVKIGAHPSTCQQEMQWTVY